MKPYVIIGTGVAGISAAYAIRSQKPDAQIVIIGDEPDIYYSRPGLAYYLTKELPEKSLYPFHPDEFRRRGFQIVQGWVTRVDPQEHLVHLSNGKRYSYLRLLIATGASAISLNLPGSDLHGVVKLDNLADARQIIRLARKARTAVVIGGGITALEIVEGLAARRVKTHYFLRRDRYWANVLDVNESRIVEHRLADEGVQLHYQTQAERIVGKRGKVAGVVTQDGKQIKCQLVAVAVGIRPRIKLAQAAGL